MVMCFTVIHSFEILCTFKISQFLFAIFVILFVSTKLFCVVVLLLFWILIRKNTSLHIPRNEWTKKKKNLKLIKFRLNMNSVIFALIWFSSCRRRVHFAINLRSLYLCLAIFFLVSFYRMLVLCCARMKVRLWKCMCFVYASLLLRIFILLKKHGNWTSKHSQDSPCFSRR